MPGDINSNYEHIVCQGLRGALIFAAENVHLSSNWRAGHHSNFLFSEILMRNILFISRWDPAFPLLCQPQLVKCCLSRNSRFFSNRHRLILEGVASCHFSLSICFKQMKKKIVLAIGRFAVSTKAVWAGVLQCIVSLLRPSGISDSPIPHQNQQ